MLHPFYQERQIYPMPPAEVPLPHIGQCYHLTTYPPLASRKVAQAEGVWKHLLG